MRNLIYQILHQRMKEWGDFFSFVLIITCTSSSVNPITDKAFITAFQLFLSLTELILGQFPWTRQLDIRTYLLVNFQCEEIDFCRWNWPFCFRLLWFHSKITAPLHPNPYKWRKNNENSATHTPWPDIGISVGFSPDPVHWASYCLLHPRADRRCGSSSHRGSGAQPEISPAGSSGCDRPPALPGRGSTNGKLLFSKYEKSLSSLAT